MSGSQHSSPEFQTGTAGRVKGKSRQTRACDYCRAHRIKCVVVEGDERCKRCIDHDEPCERSADPPKVALDARPRRRALFKKSGMDAQQQGVEASFLGSSSFALMAWKYAPQMSSIIDRFRGIDDRYDLYRGSVGGLEDDGLLVGQSNAGSITEKSTMISVSLAKSRLLQALGAESVLTALYETCRDRIIPFFPVISVSESLLADQATEDHVNRYAAVDPASTPPTPLPHIVRMIHCALTARSREVPEEIRRHVLSALHSLLTGPEMTKIIATNCLASVQVLMLLSMCDDLNGSDAGAADGAVWRNVGTAIRIAIYIALHRNVSPSHVPYFQLNRRLRVWGACVIMDRWLAIRSGYGISIDSEEYDAPVPRWYADGIREGDHGNRPEAVFPCFRFMSELTSMSILLGRAYRMIGSPAGLRKADDISLMLLQSSIDSWIAQLPESWPYSIRLTLDSAPSLMNLFIVALEFTFQRSLLWPTSPIPSHITYRPSKERLAALNKRAEQAVHWLNTPEGAFYLDVWSNVVYPAVCCVIISLKALEESKDQHHSNLLEMADNAIQQWAIQSPSDTIRARTASMSALLRSAGVEDASAAISVQEMLSGFGNRQMQTEQPVSETPGASSSEGARGGYDWIENPAGFPGFDYDISGLDSSWFE